MKRNVLIVLILLVVAGAFMYLSKNTDLFKGALISNNQLLSTGQVEDKQEHMVDFIMDYYDEQLNVMKANLNEYRNIKDNDEAKLKELNSRVVDFERKVNETRSMLIAIYNLDSFENIALKKVGEDYVPCDVKEVETNEACISFADIGMSAETLQSLLGLDPYDVSTLQDGTVSLPTVNTNTTTINTNAGRLSTGVKETQEGQIMQPAEPLQSTVESTGSTNLQLLQ